jgi:hypothetical protein
MVARFLVVLAILAGATTTPAVAQPPMQGVTLTSPRSNTVTLAPVTPFGKAYGCTAVGIDVWWNGVLIGYASVTPNTGAYIYETTSTAAGMVVDIRVYTPIGVSAWATNVTVTNN